MMFIAGRLLRIVQQMYVVTPYLNFYEDMNPPDVMYSVKSYHGISHFRDSTGNVTNTVGPAMEKDLEEIISRNQSKLIDELTAFIDCLSEALISCSLTKTEAAFRKPRIPNTLQQRFSFRKGYVCTSSKEMDSYHHPTITVFGTTNYPMNTITLVGDTKELWLKNLAKVGANTSVLFQGLNDGISTPRYIIELQSSKDSKNLVAQVNAMKVSGHIALWKLLGALTSLYPTTSEYADICTHMDYWLVLLDDVLSNRSNENNLCRQMCTALGHHDYLVPNVDATLIDVLAYSFITEQSYHANNVELWLRRIDKLLQ